MDKIDDVPIIENNDASDPVPGGQQSIRFDGRGLDTPTPNGSFDPPPGTLPQQPQSFATNGRSERHQLSNPAELLNESNPDLIASGGQDPYQNVPCRSTSRQEHAIESSVPLASGDDISICSGLPPDGANQTVKKKLHLKLTSSAAAVQKEESDESNQSGVASGGDGDLCKPSGQLDKRIHNKERNRRLARESRERKKKELQHLKKKNKELVEKNKKIKEEVNDLTQVFMGIFMNIICPRFQLLGTANGASQMLPQPDAVALTETGDQAIDYCIDNLRNMNDEHENTSVAPNAQTPGQQGDCRIGSNGHFTEVATVPLSLTSVSQNPVPFFRPDNIFDNGGKRNALSQLDIANINVPKTISNANEPVQGKTDIEASEPTSSSHFYFKPATSSGSMSMKRTPSQVQGCRRETQNESEFQSRSFETAVSNPHDTYNKPFTLLQPSSGTGSPESLDVDFSEAVGDFHIEMRNQQNDEKNQPSEIPDDIVNFVLAYDQAEVLVTEVEMQDFDHQSDAEEGEKNERFNLE